MRQRARVGLWPGQVSTASFVQARRQRWSIFVALALVVVAVIIPFAIASSRPTDSPTTVVAVLGSEAQTSRGRFEVFLDTGAGVFFDRDPGVREGDHVLVRHRGSGAPLGIVVNGRYIAARPDPNQAPGAIVVAVFEAFVLAFFVPVALWQRRTYKQLKADLHAPLETARGRYIGSWTWRGLTSTTANARSVGHLRGIPVAIEREPGHITWYGAPVELLTQLRHFETTIATGSRDVIVTFHPHSKAIAKLESSDGMTVLDLARSIDELHPETGLSLKVSRRRRHRHLPDR